jgi:hypothetical protein
MAIAGVFIQLSFFDDEKDIGFDDGLFDGCCGGFCANKS